MFIDVLFMLFVLPIFLLILLLASLYSYSKLSTRIQKCEEQIRQEIRLRKEATGAILSSPIAAVEKKQVTPPVQKVPQTTAHKAPLASKQKKSTPKMARQVSKNWETIRTVIEENWTGVFGSIALVIGAVCFGLTAEIMQRPEMRIGVLLFFSLLLLVGSQRLKKQARWMTLCGWLQAIGGAIILFTTIGAGGIKGLQCIHSSVYALVFLCIGIAVNLLLATTASTQKVASLHVILSIVALCIAPQTAILLPLGALAALIGMGAAYRSRWDLHLLFIVSAFAMQNTVWTLALHTDMLPWMHYLAIGSSALMGIVAASIHYSKKYASPQPEILPFVAHVSNWGLLVWNIWLHAEFFPGTPFVFGTLAAAGFTLSRMARRRNIHWLYQVDTLLSQLLAVCALISLSELSINPLDISLLIFVETLTFTFMCQAQREMTLLRASYLFHYVACLALFHHALAALSPDSFGIYIRLTLATAGAWGFWLKQRIKYFTDDLNFLLFGKKQSEKSVSITVLFGSLFLLTIYFFGFHSPAITLPLLVLTGLIALWRQRRENRSWGFVLGAHLSVFHLISWGSLFTFLWQGTTPSIITRVDLWGLILLDTFLIFRNLLEFKTVKKNAHDLVIYALATHVGLLSYILTKPTSALLPGLTFLALSLIALETTRIVPNWNTNPKGTETVKKGFTYVGIAFLLGFLGQFISVHLQVSPIWEGLPLRWIIEGLGVTAILYWIAFYPKQIAPPPIAILCKNRLVELCLAFLTLCTFTEIGELWRPLVWVVGALGLFLGTVRKNWPTRLYTYSLIYFIASISHTAFLTSSLTAPKIFIFEKYFILTFLAIACQLLYTYVIHKWSPRIEGKATSLLYAEPSLSTLLPTFFSIALLFGFNFEKALLTLLWVGLASIYLALGLLLRSKQSVRIGMGALACCSARLILFDLTQSDLAIRALVFVGVGIFMLGVSTLCKKYKHRVTG